MRQRACTVCLAQCQTVHGSEDEAEDAVPSVCPSFLRKFGADNTYLLHIPASFVKSNVKRLGTSLTLEGPSTEVWTVAVEGSFAKCTINLKLGWPVFVKDHHLQLGDQLLFALKADSYFYVEIYDESGCKKLSALDAVNSLKPLDSNPAMQEPDAKPLEQEADKILGKSSGAGGSNGVLSGSPLSRLTGKKQKERSEPVIARPSSKKALISLSSDDSDGENPSAPGANDDGAKQARSLKLPAKNVRGRPKKSQDFYQDDEDNDFNLFHRRRNTPARKASISGVEGDEKALRRAGSSSAAKEKQKVAAAAAAAAAVARSSKGAYLHEKVGHGMMRCSFVIDGSLEDYPPGVEAS